VTRSTDYYFAYLSVQWRQNIYLLEVGRTQKFDLEPNLNRTLVCRTELFNRISNRTRTEFFRLLLFTIQILK